MGVTWTGGPPAKARGNDGHLRPLPDLLDEELRAVIDRNGEESRLWQAAAAELQSRGAEL